MLELESQTLKGKEQLGVRGKLGTLFALHLLLCSAICSRHTPDDKLYLPSIWVRARLSECNTTLRDGFVLMVVKRGIRCPRIALKSFALKLDNRNVMTANHGIRCKQHMGTRVSPRPRPSVNDSRRRQSHSTYSRTLEADPTHSIEIVRRSCEP